MSHRGNLREDDGHPDRVAEAEATAACDAIREESNSDGRNEKKSPKKRHSARTNRKRKQTLPRDGEDRRRVLRAKYRELRKEIVHGRFGTGTESGYNSGRDVNNKLFQRVHHTRELVLDAENIDAIVDLYRDQADALLQGPRYDPLRLVNKSREKWAHAHQGSARSNGGDCDRGGAATSFDWLQLGREVGVRFHAVPTGVRFLSATGCLPPPVSASVAKLSALPGPVGKMFQRGRAQQHRNRRRATLRRQRRKVAEESCGEETTPVVVVAPSTDFAGDSGSSDSLSAAQKSIKFMKRRLRERHDEEVRRGQGSMDGIDGVQFLFNPNSFTQTVENIFHFSFLIRKGEARIGVHLPETNDVDNDGSRRQPPGLYVAPTRRPDNFAKTGDDSPWQEGGAKVNTPSDSNPKQSEHPEPTQAVFSFTMRDWRKLCGAYKVQGAGDLGHRETKIVRKGAAPPAVPPPQPPSPSPPVLGCSTAPKHAPLHSAVVVEPAKGTDAAAGSPRQRGTLVVSDDAVGSDDVSSSSGTSFSR